MAMLADSVEVVIGVDTHKHTHTAAVLAAVTGQTQAVLTVPPSPTATGSCSSWPANTMVSGYGRSRAPAATVPG
jgi:hypothetical protein